MTAGDDGASGMPIAAPLAKLQRTQAFSRAGFTLTGAHRDKTARVALVFCGLSTRLATKDALMTTA